MPTFRQRIEDFFRGLIPTNVITRFDPRSSTAALAHTLTVDRVQSIFRAAESGNTTDLFALYRDILLAHAHLQGRFGDRKRAVLGDTVSVQPFDKKAAADIAAKDALWPITNHPDWLTACNHLLDATLWPVAVVEKVFRPGSKDRVYDLARLIPVSHELLDFRNGRLQIKDTDEEGRPTGAVHDPDPNRYVVHRGHLLTTADHWGGPMRSLVFWWLLGTMDREWWARFLDRYGAPFTVGRYDKNDDESRAVLQQAFSMATKLGGLVVTRETEVEIKQAAASDSGDAYEKFHEVCNREISKLIVGQTLSSDAQATGLGSGVANTQESVRQDIRQFDARLLGLTITTQLAAQFIRINGIQGAAPIFVWGTASPAEHQATAQLLTSLKNAGLRVADEGIETLSERFGLPLERDQGGGPMPGGLVPYGVRTFSAAGLKLADHANDAVSREAAATLSQSLGKHHATIRQIILDSKTPAEAVTKVETFCAKFDASESARIIEEVLLAYAANGSVVHARG
jgi:phage gp29-like protein